MSFFFLLLIIGALCVGALLVTVVILVTMSASKKSSPSSGKGPPPSQTDQTENPNDQRERHQEERQRILTLLAEGEITREEAEQRISERGISLSPSAPPQTSSRGEKGLSKGCLVALIVGLVGLILVPVLLALLIFGLRVHAMKASQQDHLLLERQRMEELHRAPAMKVHAVTIENPQEIRPGPKPIEDDAPETVEDMTSEKRKGGS